MKPRTIQAFIALFIYYVIADMAWHGFLLMSFYETRLAAINGVPSAQTMPVFILLFEAIAAAIGVYFIPKVSKDVTSGAWNGALLGLLVCSAINFVNHNLIMKWDLTMMTVDTIWGIVMGAIGGALLMWIWNRK